ncbi:MAG: succinate dehydrogenase iron-sulfur subunit [Parachlamydiales bacterium]|jgi:succinate dehydrogenase / fumarate reductase iron-sulfur subunit
MSEQENKTFILKIYRGTPGNQYWEEFELLLQEGMNIISALMEIQLNPVTSNGKKVSPISWEQGCLEEVCGSCSMLINGKPRQACTALIGSLIQEKGSTTITLAPFTKFPLIRDLVVNRDSMFDNLKKVHAWVDAEGLYDRGFGPEISPAKQEVMYELSTCMTCGCCVEACPQVSSKSKFVGPQIISQVRLFDMHPIGKQLKPQRMQEMMAPEGINACGNAQNCVRVCPKKIPLTDSIAEVYRDVTLFALKKLFSLPGRDE